jgi:glutamyl/glutaminyl-tRNA synthetase
MKYNTRIAPSPTGMMHVGTARTALFNYICARATGGRFILRIDDTDQERNQEKAIQPIYEGLKWLGLDWDHTFRQSERKYDHVARALLAAGYAVELDNGAIALRGDIGLPGFWIDDIAGNIPITKTNIEQIDRKLILTRGGDKLGMPTYQFCSVVDDFDFDVNYIIRGVDHTTNTPKQIAIWLALSKIREEKPFPKFAHIGLIFKDKKKMSKRDGAASLLDYRDKGYVPDALFNFLLRLGWGPSIDNKANSILTREAAIAMFLTSGNMRNSNCNFDVAKLEWNNKVYKKMQHDKVIKA